MTTRHEVTKLTDMLRDDPVNKHKNDKRYRGGSTVSTEFVDFNIIILKK